MLRDALLVCGKDLRLEMRSRVATNHVLPFVLAVVMLFAFALDADTATLRKATSGLFWVTVLFAATLLVQRSAAIERQDGIGDALRLSGLSATGLFLGKTLALIAELLVLEVLLGIAVIVFYDVRLQGAALLGAVAVISTICIAAVGSIYGPLAAGLRGRETVLPLLFLPALAPVLLGASRAFEIALGRGVGNGWSWAALLGLLAAIYLVVGLATSGPLLEEA